MSNTTEKPNRTGKRFVVRFESETELKRLKRAAAKQQAELKRQMGSKFPNLSMFIADAARHAADEILERDLEAK